MIAMPGILPMKVIKLGTSAQSRIAQACDRCRSKKIRCDGISPCCTQCANVGFECRTSDKLSRRAFPRGYTESLEERVRQLENEAKELKVLLDEKDEKIDILSKVHPDSTCRSTDSSTPPMNSKSVIEKAEQDEGDFVVEQPSFVRSDGQQDPCFAGSSSGRSLVGRCHAGIVLALLLMCIRCPQDQGPRKRQNRAQSRGRTILHGDQSADDLSRDTPVNSGDQDAASSRVGSTGQHFFPRVGSSTSHLASADIFENLCRLSCSPRRGSRPTVHRTTPPGVFDCCSVC